uniref:Uncharacterized protein n=1 Tax=viral metagenome TaxID=1070528 RepID=A0A6M3JSS8_9ZZZZ
MTSNLAIHTYGNLKARTSLVKISNRFAFTWRFQDSTTEEGEVVIYLEELKDLEIILRNSLSEIENWRKEGNQ